MFHSTGKRQHGTTVLSVTTTSWTRRALLSHLLSGQTQRSLPWAVRQKGSGGVLSLCPGRRLPAIPGRGKRVIGIRSRRQKSNWSSVGFTLPSSHQLLAHTWTRVTRGSRKHSVVQSKPVSEA